MTATVNADMRLLLEWVFENALDEDKSGFIEEREANRVAKYCGYGGPDGDITALWTSMLREMDTDGDGRISKEEYVVFMSKSLEGSVAAARNLKDEVDAKLNQKAALDNNYAPPWALTIEDYRDPESIYAQLVPRGGLEHPPVKLLKWGWMETRADKLRSATTDEERRALALPRRQDLERDEPDAFYSADVEKMAAFLGPEMHFHHGLESSEVDELLGRSTGSPDAPDGELRYRMIEVKGPGDRLQDNQKRWLQFCARHDMPVSVCYVTWAACDGETVDAGDADTTAGALS